MRRQKMENQCRCPKCSKELSKDFHFCPYCSEPLSSLSSEIKRQNDVLAQLKLLNRLIDNIQDEKDLKFLESLVAKCKQTLK